jgi:hypothetical protein
MAVFIFSAMKTSDLKNCVAFSPQSNYIDGSTEAASEVVPTFAGRGCCVVSAVNPFGRSLDLNHYFAIQVAPQLSSLFYIHKRYLLEG